MSIIQNLSEVSDVYLGTNTINSIYAGTNEIYSGQQELPWTQPKLSANGTIGGNAFACEASTTQSTGYAWKAFDGKTSVDNYWLSQENKIPAWIKWYNPNPLKTTKIIFNHGVSGIGGIINEYIIQASVDNSNWIDIKSGKTGNTSVNKNTTVNISNDNFYQYWRLYIKSILQTGSKIVGVHEITITATQLA